MKQPTKAQVKEFWEGYGFKYERRNRRNSHWHCWTYPNGTEQMTSPDINLNNLFKYTVPVAIDIIQRKHIWTYRQAEAELFKIWLAMLKTNEYALALFWTVSEIIKGKNERN